MRQLAPGIVTAELQPQETMPSSETHGTMAGDRLAEALRAKRRCLTLTGGSRPGRDAVVGDFVATSHDRTICVANPLAAPLTLLRIMFQVHGEGMEVDPEDAAAILKTLIAQGEREGRVVLVIQDAETLDQEALLWLQHLVTSMDPAYAPLSILFVGSSAFLAELEDDRFAGLRRDLINVSLDASPDPVASTQIEIPPAPAAMPEAATSPSIGAPADGIVSPRIRRPGSSRLYWAVGATAFLAAIAVTSSVLHRNADEPAGAFVSPQPETGTPAGPTSPTSLPAPGDAAAIPPAVVPAEPVPAPAAKAPDSDPAAPSPSQLAERVRQDFDAFLDRAGRDTAQLTAAQRQALFREYLEWRRQSALKSGAPAP